jgi:FKBP-type peptidyl-prolyl cis-trans isomerase FkpA
VLGLPPLPATTVADWLALAGHLGLAAWPCKPPATARRAGIMRPLQPFPTSKDPHDHHPSGLQYEDTVTGSGAEARAGQRVTVHYTGWLHDPTAAKAAARSSTAARTAATLRLPLGAGMVIRGWDEGVQGMKVGGTRVLTIPPSWATARAAPAA